MIQGSKGYWLTTPILAIQVFTDHMQVRELLHLMGVEQAERNMASVHQKIYIVQWIFRAITRISHKQIKGFTSEEILHLMLHLKML